MLSVENVFCGDLEFDESDISTGNLLCEGFSSGIDKIPVMERIQRRNPGMKLIYIGDSMSDIPSMCIFPFSFICCLSVCRLSHINCTAYESYARSWCSPQFQIL